MCTDIGLRETHEVTVLYLCKNKDDLSYSFAIINHTTGNYSLDEGLIKDQTSTFVNRFFSAFTMGVGRSAEDISLSGGGLIFRFMFVLPMLLFALFVVIFTGIISIITGTKPRAHQKVLRDHVVRIIGLYHPHAKERLQAQNLNKKRFYKQALKNLIFIIAFFSLASFILKFMPFQFVFIFPLVAAIILGVYMLSSDPIKGFGGFVGRAISLSVMGVCMWSVTETLWSPMGFSENVTSHYSAYMANIVSDDPEFQDAIYKPGSFTNQVLLYTKYRSATKTLKGVVEGDNSYAAHCSDNIKNKAAWCSDFDYLKENYGLDFRKYLDDHYVELQNYLKEQPSFSIKEFAEYCLLKTRKGAECLFRPIPGKGVLYTDNSGYKGRTALQGWDFGLNVFEYRQDIKKVKAFKPENERRVDAMERAYNDIKAKNKFTAQSCDYNTYCRELRAFLPEESFSKLL